VRQKIHFFCMDLPQSDAGVQGGDKAGHRSAGILLSVAV